MLVDLAEQPDARAAHLKIGKIIEAAVAVQVGLDKLGVSLCTEAEIDRRLVVDFKLGASPYGSCRKQTDCHGGKTREC